MIDYSIVGKRFGRLVVLGLDHVRGNIIQLDGVVNVIAEKRPSCIVGV